MGKDGRPRSNESLRDFGRNLSQVKVRIEYFSDECNDNDHYDCERCYCNCHSRL